MATENKTLFEQKFSFHCKHTSSQMCKYVLVSFKWLKCVNEAVNINFKSTPKKIEKRSNEIGQ